MEPAPLLQMRDVSVEFGRVRILDKAWLNVGQGEIHALLGENGAGKSSLMKVLFGLYPPVEGQIVLRGEERQIENPHRALEAGIAMIHQELPFARHLSVAQNIFLGREPRRGPLRFIDENRLNRESAELLAPFPIDVDPRVPLGSLSVAQQQIVAIAKALSTGADLIVLDEATTALTEHETARLFDMLRELKAAGKTFIMITHKLDEVFQVADHVTVMRDGRTIATVRTAEVTAPDLVRYMVGREVTDLFPPRVSHRSPAETTPLLRVEGLTTKKLKDVSFEVHRGEVLGVAGLMGAGRTELFDALFGADKIESGEIFLDGQPVRISEPAQAIARKVAYVTEDRKLNGLALQLGIQENVTLPIVEKHLKWGLVQERPLGDHSRFFVSKLKVSARSTANVGVLSGGNQQKVVLAKWLATGADLFFMDEPTRGIDVGTKLEVYDLISELTAAGKAVLLVSSELPELMAMSDRFIVLSEGCVVRALTREEATPEQIIYHASIKPDRSEPVA